MDKCLQRSQDIFYPYIMVCYGPFSIVVPVLDNKEIHVLLSLLVSGAFREGIKRNFILLWDVDVDFDRHVVLLQGSLSNWV